MRLFRKNRELGQAGFTMGEAVVTIAMLVIAMAGVGKIVQKIIDVRSMSVSLQRQNVLAKAFEATYRENIEYATQNCYGWTNGNCVNLTILPRKKSGTVLTLRTYSDTAKKVWEEAACTVTTVAVPEYDVTCSDGYGGTVAWNSTSNEHAANTYYKNGYLAPPTPFVVNYTMPAGGRSVPGSWSSGALDSEFLSSSRDKRRDLVRALATYHLSRLTHESITNTGDTVNGGLATSDDVIVPWVWQSVCNSTAIGSCATDECTGIESGGSWGCGNWDAGVTTNRWRTDNAWLEINTVAEFTQIFTNINLSERYRVDGFGNAVVIRLFTDSSGTTLASVPPRPQVSYAGVLPAGFMPPYRGTVGVYDGGWVNGSRETIVYPQ